MKKRLTGNLFLPIKNLKSLKEKASEKSEAFLIKTLT